MKLRFGLIIALLLLTPPSLTGFEQARGPEVQEVPTGNDPNAKLSHYFHVVLRNFDPDTKLINVSVSVRPGPMALICSVVSKLQNGILDAVGMKPTHDPRSCYYSEILITDGAIYSNKDQGEFFFKKQVPDFVQRLDIYTKGEPSPDPVQKEMNVLGNPGLFPFDKYLLFMRIDAPSFVAEEDEEDEKQQIADYAMGGLFVPGKAYKVVQSFSADKAYVQPELPGFVTKTIDYKDLKSWGVSATEFKPLDNGLRPAFIFVEIQRPFSFRLIAVVVGILAILYAFLLGLQANLREHLQTITASFLTFWALRAVLASSSPKAPSLLDYATLLLFAIPIAMILFRTFAKARKVSTNAAVDDEWAS